MGHEVRLLIQCISIGDCERGSPAICAQAAFERSRTEDIYFSFLLNELLETASRKAQCDLCDGAMDTSHGKPMRVEEVVTFFYDLVRDEAQLRLVRNPPNEGFSTRAYGAGLVAGLLHCGGGRD